MILKSYELQKKTLTISKYNFYLLYGENDGLKKDIRDKIIKGKKAEDENIELLSFYENEIFDNEKNFYNTVYAGSLFSKKKLITISNGTDKIFNHMQDILDKSPENISIIIYANILEKKSKLRNFFETDSKTGCVACYLDNERDLEMIAKTELSKNKITLSREAINLLIESSNGDRNNIRNEIQKITAYSINKKNLDIDEIKSIVNFSGEYKSDSLVNECLCGNTSQYSKILSELYMNTVNQIFLLRILNNKILRLLNMKRLEKDYNNLDVLLNATKPPIFWKEKPIVKKQLTIWSLDELKKTIYKINDIEILCKKNPQASKIVFFKFFNEICKKASNYS